MNTPDTRWGGDVDRRAAGFTLVEMLVVVALTGVLVAALATAFAFGVQAFAATQGLVDDAANVQVTTSRFLGDAISAEQVRSSQTCGDDGSGYVRGFTWNVGPDDDTATAVYADWYLDEQGSGDDAVTVLVRAVCGTASAGPDIVLRSVVDASIDCSGRTCTLTWSTDVGTNGSLVAWRRPDAS